MELNPEKFFINLQNVLQTRPSLGRLETYIVHCVLKKSSDKLKIIESLMPGEGMSKQGICYQPLTLKLEEVKIKVVPSEWKTAEVLLTSTRVKNIIGFLLEVLGETIAEIESNGSYNYLDYTLNCENWSNFDKIMLKEENIQYNEIVNDLKEKIQNCKFDFQKTQNFLLEMTGPCLDRKLTDVYVQEESAKLHNLVKVQTRVEQNFLQLKEKENEVQQLIETQNSDTIKENRINEELQFYLSTVINELQDKVNYWTHRYNKEIEKLDVDILHTTSKIEELKKNREETLEEFNMKQEKMAKLQKESDEQERLMRRKQITSRAAVTIQTWWRRILIKRGFKKKSEAKPIKGKGKKKTGKKN
ncbi:dynein regulatory complex protein 9-like [Homalodisca vitripennis]|uniref:dynein regulatory complex protein 9-like n=1 Tax=Homalodisca vitripennis TaxID=197043 RepID=UPI001EEAC7FD|nr:dynein regulatory complex protein 9-like [Homalodisca vitripennis]